MSDSGLLTMTLGGKGSATLPERRVQSFLYLLLRDYLPSGDVELLFEMLKEADFDGPIIYDCPHTEALSGEMARRLLGSESGMSDNEEGQHEDHKADKEEDSAPEGGDTCKEFRSIQAKLDKAYPEGSVFDVGSRIATGKAKKVRAVYNEDGFDSEGFNEQGYDEDNFDAQGIDPHGYNRDGVFSLKKEATGEGYPKSNEDDARVTEAAEDDLGIDFLEAGRRGGSGSVSGETEKSTGEGETEEEGADKSS